MEEVEGRAIRTTEIEVLVGLRFLITVASCRNQVFHIGRPS